MDEGFRKVNDGNNIRKSVGKEEVISLGRSTRRKKRGRMKVLVKGKLQLERCANKYTKLRSGTLLAI